jgi:hypothetical protein
MGCSGEDWSCGEAIQGYVREAPWGADKELVGIPNLGICSLGISIAASAMQSFAAECVVVELPANQLRFFSASPFVDVHTG